MWKFSANQQRQMRWDSPWGKGFPGWHIECSAMAEKYLGKLFDIHLGGEDHISVHHSNEIAQSQARNQTRMANYWMHGYFLQIDHQKVAKSGKTLRLRSLQDAGYDPLAYRYLVLTAHYRSRLNFSWKSLKAASKALARIRKILGDNASFKTNVGEISISYMQKFNAKLLDDLNTPQALAVLWEVAQSEMTREDKRVTILQMDKVLGLNLQHITIVKMNIPESVTALAELRLLARAQKDWQESDRLRIEIEESGFKINDVKDGSYILSWK